MSLRKTMTAVLTVIATLALSFVGVSSARAAGVDPIVLHSNQRITSEMAENFNAYKLMDYNATDSVVSTPATTPPSLSHIATVKINDNTETLIASALNSAGVTVTSNNPWSPGGSNSSAENDLLNLTTTSSIALDTVTTSLGMYAQNGAFGSATSGVVVDSKDHDVSLAVPSEGLYLVTDDNSYGKPFLVSTTMEKDNVTYHYLGKYQLGVTSPRTGSEYTPSITYTNVAGLGGDKSPLPYVAVGDTAHFTITMRIPDKDSYKSFVLIDQCDPTACSKSHPEMYPQGYTIDRNSIKFYHRADGQSGNGTQFSLPTCDSAGTSKCPMGVGWGQNNNFGVSEDSFRVQDSQILSNPDGGTVSSSTPRNPGSIISKYSGQTLVITYDAIVTKEQATNQIDSVVWDLNNAGQANSPDSVRNGNTIPANVKMTQVNIVKRRNGEVIELGVSDSQFTLEDITGGTSHGFMQRSSSGWSHLRAVATTRTVAPRVRMRSSEAAPTLTTDGNGTINLYGLGEGKYKLHLKKAPDGYLSGPDFTTDVIIDVSHNHSRVTSDPSSSPSGRATWAYKGGDAGIPSTRNSSGTLIVGTPHTFKLIILKSINQLPETGGNGVIVGIVLITVLTLIGWCSITLVRRFIL